MLCKAVKIEQGKSWAVSVLIHVSGSRVRAYKNSLENSEQIFNNSVF